MLVNIISIYFMMVIYRLYYIIYIVYNITQFNQSTFAFNTNHTSLNFLPSTITMSNLIIFVALMLVDIVNTLTAAGASASSKTPTALASAAAFGFGPRVTSVASTLATDTTAASFAAAQASGQSHSQAYKPRQPFTFPTMKPVNPYPSYPKPSKTTYPLPPPRTITHSPKGILGISKPFSIDSLFSKFPFTFPKIGNGDNGQDNGNNGSNDNGDDEDDD
eukprot:TRINITY_DN3045_c0_g1_i3.p2 TRINITY_DN3045_c0_g1~~TRINITY_DN3045_c0_g1_i3.p2  ORF type:complete len:219 (-),score=10.85 TRINITY_DN3045_c0_g1_i3:349-1005(-)